MKTNKQGVVASLDEDNMNVFDADKRNIIDDCSESFILSHPKGNNLQGALAEQCIFHHGYGKECGWSETYVGLSNHHEQVLEHYYDQQSDPPIFHTHLGYWRDSGWSETYIYLCTINQHLLHYL